MVRSDAAFKVDLSDETYHIGIGHPNNDGLPDIAGANSVVWNFYYFTVRRK